ncbi:Reticulon-domain-containing protein [Pyronema omphalodes]|nr:Reticulon-domain-containing protein [Pyronema omphalodes]
MSENTHILNTAPEGTPAQQVLNGTHPIIQETKADFRGLANSTHINGDYADATQPVSQFHNVFYNLFTWKFPTASGFFFLSTIFTIVAFRYVNVLRYVFKALYMSFGAVTLLEIAGKPLGASGIVSSFRPERYYTVPRESMESVFEHIHELVNFFVLEFQRVIYVENVFTSLSAFVASFFGYFLIKYIPFWALLLLATVTAFTAPLIYLNNKEVIDDQIKLASDFVNAQLESTKKVTSKYAAEVAARAQHTAADIQSKVQTYTHKTSPSATPIPVKSNGNGPSTATAHDFLSGAPSVPANPPYPRVPVAHPSVEDEPLTAYGE